MSAWTDLLYYSKHTQDSNTIVRVCDLLSAVRAEAVSVMRIIEFDECESVEIETDVAIGELAGLLDSIEVAGTIELALECPEYLKAATAEIRMIDKDIDFAFLGASITNGYHELSGFSVRMPPGSGEQCVSPGFSLCIGGDDAESEFRQAWVAIQRAEFHSNLRMRLERLVGGVEVDMSMST